MIGNLTINQALQLFALLLLLLLLIPAYRRSKTIRFGPSMRFAALWVLLAILLALVERWFELRR